MIRVILHYLVLASVVLLPLIVWLRGKPILSVFEVPRDGWRRYLHIAVICSPAIAALLGVTTAIRAFGEPPIELAGMIFFAYLWTRAFVVTEPGS